ncbi:MAG: hypothetical protein Wins2KO_20520 [Winogradskyella sp.]
MNYHEITLLKSQYKKYEIKISEPYKIVKSGVFFVKLTILSQSWNILIDDEFGDFTSKNPIFNWFLVLYALETYKESQDVLEWSNEYNVNPVNLLEYYKELATILNEIEAIIGEIDPLISSFDYTLRTGIINALLDEHDV